MNNLVLKGLTEVQGMKFHDIEGGFGKSKKSMLVKDIAAIHDRELREINERINLNKKRFKDRVDVIDLLGIGLSDTEIKKFGFTQQSINSYRGLKGKGQNTGIYILSERGYAKLLKILENDKAWEQYDKLVDGYFGMRKTIKDSKQDTLSDDKQKLIEARLRNAKARQANILLKIADKSSLNDNYKQVLFSYASSIIADKPLIPLPVAEEKTYSAGEIGKMLGISGNKVGRLANKHNLKTEKYGKLFHDKSKYSNKEVETFRYCESIIPVLRKILEA